MSDFASFMAWMNSSEAASRVAYLEAYITDLCRYLQAELHHMNQRLGDALSIQTAVVEREILQDKLEEFIYQFEKVVEAADDESAQESSVTKFFRLAYFLGIVEEENINTSLIRGRDNKAAFERTVARAQKLAASLKRNPDVTAAIAEIKQEEAKKRREELREQERKQKLRQKREELSKRRRNIAVLAAISMVLGVALSFFTSENWKIRSNGLTAPNSKTADQEKWKLTSEFQDVRKKAEQGDIDAQYRLAQMYFRGEKVPQDYSKAFQWAEKAARQNHKGAQNYLGRMYFSGLGVLQDYSSALHWFSKSAQQGNAEAQHNMGALYYNGLGVPKDPEKAVEWLCKSACTGLPALY